LHHSFVAVILRVLLHVITAQADDDQLHDQQQPQHSRLFPGSDEYDSKILDDSSIYGSPYGGFSRATRSRLANMPLRLPNTALMQDTSKNEEERDETDHQHYDIMETSDALGRKYVCRVYHEDELDPDSVIESMFDTPLLNTRQVTDEEEDEEEEEEEVEDFLLEAMGEALSAWQELRQRINGVNEEPTPLTRDLLLMETQRRLKKLKGVCSQIHLGWWSYEWCYNAGVTQFHIHVDKDSSGLELRDVTGLGTFDKRKFQIPGHRTEEEAEDEDFPSSNKYSQDEDEIAQVVDSYTNGDICPETGEPRRTKVHYYCCSDKLMERYKSPVLRDGNPVVSKIVSIVKLIEDPDAVCAYSITVCTPLLCRDVKSDEDDSLLFDISAESYFPAESAPTKSSDLPVIIHKRHTVRKRRKNETIREILDRVMGKGGCIQSSTAGWWSYEYCHKKHVRQFHESISINMETGITTATFNPDEDIYFLGYYSEELDNYPPEDEWKYITNTTLPTSVGDGAPSPDGGKGTVAAYFSQEYLNGDICDNDADVTDAAIKAGTARREHTKRASSVRFACGPSFMIYVNEDHTCHYIVDVTVPALCHHPAFKIPVAKKRIVKCLLAEDEAEA